MAGTRIDEIGFGGLRLIQDPEAFCYGVDAVILAGMAAQRAKDTTAIMDMCSGNGIVPLILSHKTECGDIVGVELQSEAFGLACESVRMNGLTDRISFLNCDVIDLPKEYNNRFTVVTMNPPYTEKGSGMTGPADARTIARHETTAGIEDFLKKASEVLKDRGQLFMIHRPSRLVDLMYHGRKYGLEPKMMQLISPRQGEKPNMILLEYVKGAGRQLDVENGMYIYEGTGKYSEKILKLYL